MADTYRALSSFEAPGRRFVCEMQFACRLRFGRSSRLTRRFRARAARTFLRAPIERVQQTELSCQWRPRPLSPSPPFDVSAKICQSFDLYHSSLLISSRRDLSSATYYEDTTLEHIKSCNERHLQLATLP